MTAGPFDIAGSTLIRARVRRANSRAVVHLIPVLHSDVQPPRRALCGARSRSGQWVLRPYWLSRDCPLCAERAAKS